MEKRSFKISVEAFIISVILCIGVGVYIFNSNKTSVTVSCIEIFLSLLVILVGLYVNLKRKDVFSFINIANIFLMFVFVIRAIQVIFNLDNLSNIYVFRIYQNINGSLSSSSLPIAQASFIGFLGIASLNIAFFWRIRGMQSLAERNFDAAERKLSRRQFLAVGVCILPAIVSIVAFVMKSLVINSSISMIDIAWLYIFSALIIYLIYMKRKATITIYLILIVSFILMSLIAKRQYMVNLLLCYIIPLYYYGKDRKANIRKIILMCAALFAVVLIYGSIRDTLISAKTGTVFEEIMEEFCMYDMLVVSLVKLENLHYGLFWGYNFLSIITTPIPGLSITQFDHELTNIIFKGNFNGGIPVTLVGSLYFNFSYIGVVIGSYAFGRFFYLIRNRILAIDGIKTIMYYTVFSTFVYDIIRVGDIGREVWTVLITIFVCFVFMKIARDYIVQDKYE